MITLPFKNACRIGDVDTGFDCLQSVVQQAIKKKSPLVSLPFMSEQSSMLSLDSTRSTISTGAFSSFSDKESGISLGAT